MHERPIVLSQNEISILNAVREVVARATLPGQGHEYGVTVPQIIALVNNSRRLPFPVNDTQVAVALSMKVNGIPIFQMFRLMSTGEIVWKLCPQNIIPTAAPPAPPPLPQRQVARPPPDEYVPDTIPELEAEIEMLKKKKQVLKSKNAQLQYCFSLLQDPAQCRDSSSKVDLSVQYMRKTYAMIDWKVNYLIVKVDESLQDSRK